MKPTSRIFVVSALAVIALAAGAIFYLIPRLTQAREASSPEYEVGFGADTVRAKVLDIVEEGTITLGDQEQAYQIVLIKILDGDFAGQLLEIDLGQRRILPEGMLVAPGEEILVTLSQAPDGTNSAYFTDFVRTRPLIILLGAFVLFSVLISGWKGVRSLLGLVFSLGVILFFILPRILRGENPVTVSITGAFILLAVTLYLTYGWTLKTQYSVLGTLIALVITGLLSSYFVDLARLTGFGSEDALFLMQLSQIQIDLRGLVLGGMLIGALGVLDDLVITQASAVFELHAANPDLELAGLIRGAMRIGQDHVAATVNTLVLAYTGASLPMWLLFSLSGQQIGHLINLEYIAEEIVRTLVGSLGLVAAVPVTTVISAIMAVRGHHLGSLRPWLGPENSAGHTH
jgi:uncharacterized membrane protein